MSVLFKNEPEINFKIVVEFEPSLWLNFEYSLLLYLLKFYIRVARLTNAEKRASAKMISANPTKNIPFCNLFSILYKFIIFCL